MRATFCVSYIVLKGNLVISKNKDTSVYNFFLNSGLGKFPNDISVVEMCYQLISTKLVAPSMINWTAVGQLS